MAPLRVLEKDRGSERLRKMRAECLRPSATRSDTRQSVGEAKQLARVWLG